MKHFFTVLLSVLLLPFGVEAQKLDFDLGIKLGGNFTEIDGKYWERGYKANLLGGIFIGVNGKRIGLQVEGIFAQSTYVTGDKFKDIYGDFLQTGIDSLKVGSFQVNHLSIPVLLHIRLLPFATLQLGPQFSGLVSVRDSDELMQDASKMFKSSFDGVIGLWLRLPGRFNMGARYVLGLSDVNNISNIYPGSESIDDAWRHRTLQLHIGYSIL